MPDITLAVAVTRGLLGLGDLQVNDHVNFYVSNNDFMDAQVTYNRQTATSPFMDGGFAIFRTRQQTMQNMTVEVMGEDLADLRANIDLLGKAFMQDAFYLKVFIGDAHFQYRAEAADYAVRHDGPRWIAHQVQMTFSIPCQPMPVIGVV